MNLSLLVAQGSQQKEIPIRLNQFLVGRDPECHLRPVSPLVSKRHCALLVRDGKVFLRDFDSTNGTIVNGQPLKGELELRNGDQFKIGPIEFRIKMEETAVTPPPGKTPKVAPAKTVDEDQTPSGRIDEDAVADMLLNLGDEPIVPGREDAIPTGSTVMEMVPLVEANEVPPPGSGKPEPKKTVKKAIDAKATSDAAKAILEKYMRRPRL